MDDLMFYKGWALLTAQPYAAFLAYDETKMALQEGMFHRAVAPYDGLLWLRVVEHWIRKETEWPKLPELLALLKANVPMTRVALMAPRIPNDYLPQQIYRTAIKGHLTITEACVALIPHWLETAEKDDPDTLLAQEWLTKARQGWPVKCDCGCWHPAGQPCPTCNPEQHRDRCDAARTPLKGQLPHVD